jgi:putative salt-induced outer membrane protein
MVPTEVSPLTEEPEEVERGWTNAADLGYVLTSGNTSTRTLSFDDKLVRRWNRAELTVRLGALRTQTADDRFAVGTPDDFAIVEDEANDLDNERYYVAGRFDRTLSRHFFWVVGTAWDKDKDAGVDNRTILYAGLGNAWVDTDKTRFRTDYTATFTHRIDEIEDPARDENTVEARVSWEYMNKLTPALQLDSDFVFFLNVQDANDNRFDTTGSIAARLTNVFALKFSLQLRYQNLPALEEIDLFGESGLPAGSVVTRKKKLDSMLRFSVVVTL